MFLQEIRSIQVRKHETPSIIHENNNQQHQMGTQKYDISTLKHQIIVAKHITRLNQGMGMIALVQSRRNTTHIDP